MKLHNKKMLISLISIATVALGSVGFATWIIGVQKTSTDVGNLKVETDDVKNNSIFLTASLPANATIAFGETSNNDVTDGKLANLDVYTKAVNAMKFDFASIQYKVGKEVDEAKKPAKLKMELITSDTKNASNYVTSDKNKFTSIRTCENFQYVYYYEVIDLNSDETNGNVTLNSTDSYIDTYTFKEEALKNHTFKWGSFFGNNFTNGELATVATEYSPLTYYNDFICKDVNDDNFEILTDYASKATAEIKQMKKDLETTGTTFTITLTLLDSAGNAL